MLAGCPILKFGGVPNGIGRAWDATYELSISNLGTQGDVLLGGTGGLLWWHVDYGFELTIKSLKS